MVALAVDISLKCGDYLVNSKQHSKAITLFKEYLQISQQAALSNLIVASLGKLQNQSKAKPNLEGKYSYNVQAPQAHSLYTEFYVTCGKAATPVSREASKLLGVLKWYHVTS